jgi:hypothetical protein
MKMRVVAISALALAAMLSVSPLAQTRPPAAPAFGAGAALLQVNPANPSTIEFTASTDHAALDTNGQPILTRYDVEIYTSTAAATPTKTQGIGKPTPVGGVITFTQLATITSGLPFAPGYVAKVVAVGPGGATRSGFSNPFDLTAKVPGAPGTPVVR